MLILYSSHFPSPMYPSPNFLFKPHNPYIFTLTPIPIPKTIIFSIPLYFNNITP